MEPLRLQLRVPVDGALARATREHGTLVVEAVPMEDHVVLTFRGAYPGDPVIAAALGVPSVQSVGKNGTRSLLLPDASTLEAVLTPIRAAKATLLPPLVWRAGELHVQLVVPDADAAKRAAAAFPGARVESKTRARPATPGRGKESLLGRLTARQAQALTAAIRNGYYESPRRATTAQVARALGVSRSTFEEHLRAAEGQVVHALAPLVRLRAGDAHDALDVYARFSRELGLYVHLTLREGRVAAVHLTERQPLPGAGTDHPYLARILDHLATGRGDLRDIPVDLRVGPFERRVLDALRAIPAGHVLTYGELAKRLGNPGAARAVGNALAKNPVPLLLPCHRVVPATGTVGNYSGGNGPVTKQKLLEKEGAWPLRSRAPRTAD